MSNCISHDLWPQVSADVSINLLNNTNRYCLEVTLSWMDQMKCKLILIYFSQFSMWKWHVQLLFNQNCVVYFSIRNTDLKRFMPLVSFYIPWKHQKTSDFLIFSGDIKNSLAWNGSRFQKNYDNSYKSYLLVTV